MDYFSHTSEPGYDPILGILPTAESLSHGGYETGALLTEPEHISPLPTQDIVSSGEDALSSSFTRAGHGIPIGGGVGGHVHDPSASQRIGTQGNTVTTESASASPARTPEPGPRPTQSLPPTRAASISSHTSSTDFRTMRPRGVRLGVDPKATVWECFNHEATASDRELFRGWREGLDNQTITTALFAALLGSFLIDHHNPDPGRAVAAVLVQAFILSSTTSSSSPPLSPEQITSHLMAPVLAPPGLMDVSISLIWSMSLFVCVAVVIFSVFIRHWLSEYDHELRTGSTFDYVQRRQLRFSALNTWNVPTIIPILQLSMIGAVFLFLGGWSLKLFQFHAVPASFVSAASGLLLLVYTVMTILPLFFPTCPYHNTILVLFLKVYHLVVSRIKRCSAYVHARFVRGFGVPSKTPVPPLPLPLFIVKPYQQNTLARREQEYMQLQRRALIWDAVIWLLSSSQNALTIDTALRSIFSLKYVPRKITSVLSTKVPELLYSKLSLSDIPSEDLYSKDLVSTIQMRDFLGRNLDLMMSYLHLWKCISLDGVGSPYQLSLMTGGLPQVPRKLYPELMTVWKALRIECRSLSQISARQWPIESLAVAVATEAIYFSLRRTSDKAASQMGIVSRANHPLREIEHILEWHLKSVLPNDTYLHQDVLVLLLDSLAHALYPFDSAVLRQDAMPTLDLLQRLLYTLGPHHFPVFQPLYACFIMYTGTTEERHRALEQRVNQKAETQLMRGPGRGYLQLVDSVAKLFVMIPHSDQATSFPTQTSRSLYKFTYSIGTSETLTETPLLSLPGSNTNDIVRAIHTVHVEEGREKSIHRPIWIFRLLSELYQKPEVSLESRKHIHEILCTLVCRPWPEEKSTIMIPGILNFIQTQLRLTLQDGYYQQIIAKDLCKVFITALVYSLNDDPAREALHHVVAHRWFEVLSSARQSLQNYEIDNDLTDFLETWNRDLHQHNYAEAEYDAYDYLKSRCPRVNPE